MKVQQVICTSISGGILMGQGVETLGVSQGVQDNERNDIESRFKSMLSNIKSDDNTPDAGYSFFKLDSGRYCACRVKLPKYLQPGFIHAFIVDEGYWPFYPVQIIGSSSFMDTLPDGQFNSVLPILEDVIPGDIVDFTRVSQFAAKRLEYGVDDMVCAALRFKGSKMPIYIADIEENLPMWIGAVQMSLPVKLAHSITFTTFPGDFGKCMVKGVSDVYDMQFGDREKCYLFDYMSGKISRAEQFPRLTKMVNTGYSMLGTVFALFHKFIGQFDYLELNEEMEGGCSLFLLVYLGVSDMCSKEISDGLRFAVKYGSQDTFEDILQAIDPNMDSLARIVDIHGLRAAAEFMVNAALSSKRLILMNRTYYFIYNALDHIVLDGIPDMRDILNLYSEIKIMCKQKSSGFIKYALSPERIGYLADVLTQRCSIVSASVYLGILLEGFIELGYYWTQCLLIEKFHALLDLCISSICDIKDSIDMILEVASQNEEFFSNIIILIYNRAKSKAAMDGIINTYCRLMESRDEKSVLNVRKQLNRMQAWDILYGEYVHFIYMAPDRSSYFNYYCTHIIQLIPEFQKYYFSKCIKHYITTLDKYNSHKESFMILKGYIDNEFVLDDDILPILVESFEKGLNIAAVHTEIREILHKIKKVKDVKNIKTSPDYTGLADLLLWLEQNNDMDYPIEEILKGIRDLSKLDDKTYGEYVSKFIPCILRFTKSRDDHMLILKILCSCGPEEYVFDNYIKAIKEEILNNETNGIDWLLYFLVCYFFYFEPRFRALEEGELISHISGSLEEIFISRQRKFLKEFDKNIKNEFDKMGLSVPVQWVALYGGIEDMTQKSFSERIISVFKR